MTTSGDVTVPLTVTGPSSALTVAEARYVREGDGVASSITFELRNDGSLPVVVYGIRWLVSVEDGSQPQEFGSWFDSWGLGDPIRPGEVVGSCRGLGLSRGTATSLAAEIEFVEFSDGTRRGTRAREISAAVDEQRRETVRSLRSLYRSFRTLGLPAFKTLLENSQAGKASPSDARLASRLLSLFHEGKVEQTLEKLTSF